MGGIVGWQRRDVDATIELAVAGARAGLHGIPERWRTPVHGHVPDESGTPRRYDHTDLMELSSALLA